VTDGHPSGEVGMTAQPLITDAPVGVAPEAAPQSSGAVAPAVQVRGVSQVFTRGAPPVLQGVDLTVAPGEFVCLLGASGCGKSTLLNLIAGLTEPTTGSIEVSAHRPALMFQEPALLPWLTAAGNVELALKARGVGRGDRRAEAERLLGLVNLSGAERKRVHELSGGMRQRVALARSLAQDSSVLLMDEPFAALDAITRDVLHQELTRVWAEQGLSILFVTHNVREAARLGQRVVLMGSRPGRVVREWRVDIPQPRTIESPDVSSLAAEITRELHKEISRHGQ
jgi:NitT/TauT family transport system ATP-binding protein